MDEIQNIETYQQKDMWKIRKKIMSLILPITVESVLQMTAGLVSTAMVGRLSTTSIGAIGISMRITQIIWALFKGITTGASVFVAQAYGAGNYKKLKIVIQQTLLSTIILVVILQQLIFWKADLFLSIFHKPSLMESGLLYLKTVSWGLPFMAIMLVVAAVLQGTGNGKTPMLIALIMNFANIVLNFALIFGNFGLPALGIKGAALGMIMAQFIGAMLGLYVLFNKNGVLAKLFNKSFFKINVKQIFSIYKVGLPTSFESIFWQVSAIILTQAILTYGETTYAAYQIGLQAESISYMPAVGFSVAATTFVGQALGTRDSDLGKKYLRETVKGSLLITIFTAGLLIFFPSVLMGLLTNNYEVIKVGAIYLLIMGIVQIPQNLSGVLNGALRGAGYTWVPMVVAFAGLIGIRIPLTCILAYKYNANIIFIWCVMGFDLIFRFFTSFLIYKTKDIYSKELVIEDGH